MANVPFSKDVPKIYVPSLSVPNIRVPQLYVPKLEAPGKGSYKLPERKHVKDLGDIVLGNPITGTKQLRHTLKDNGYEEWINVPIMNRLVGLSVMTKERLFEPVAEGEYWTALINTLETFGNSLDILANPVKSLMPWAGGGTTDDFLKSMGWLDNEYREIYNWDTGNFVVDLLGEFLSDPVTLASLGSQGVVKSLLKSPDDIAMSVMKNIPDDLIQATTAQTTKNVVKTALKNNVDINEDFLKAYYKYAQSQYDELYNTLKKELGNNPKLIQTLKQNRKTLTPEIIQASPKTTQKYLMRRGEIEDLTRMFKLTKELGKREQILQAFTNIQNTKGYQTLQAWRKIHSGVKKLDDSLFNIALMTTPPLGFIKALYKYGVKPVFNAAWKSFIHKLKEVDMHKVLDVINVSEVATKELEHSVNAAYLRVRKDWESFFKEFDRNLNMDTLRKLYRDIVLDTDDAAFDLKLIEQKFIVKLYELVPEIRYVADAPAALKKYLKKTDYGSIANKWQHLHLNELKEYLATVEIGVAASTQISRAAVREGVMQRLQDYILDIMDRTADNYKTIYTGDVLDRYADSIIEVVQNTSITKIKNSGLMPYLDEILDGYISEKSLALLINHNILDDKLAREIMDQIAATTKLTDEQILDGLLNGDFGEMISFSKNKELKDFSPKIVLNFLDDTLLHGHLNDLDVYIARIKKKDYRQYIKLMTALEPLGINKDNLDVLVPLIKKARTSNDPEAMKKLWSIMLDASQNVPVSEMSAKVSSIANKKYAKRVIQNRNTQQKAVNELETLSHTYEDGPLFVDKNVKKRPTGEELPTTKSIDQDRRRSKVTEIPPEARYSDILDKETGVTGDYIDELQGRLDAFVTEVDNMFDVYFKPKKKLEEGISKTKQPPVHITYHGYNVQSIIDRYTPEIVEIVQDTPITKIRSSGLAPFLDEILDGYITEESLSLLIESGVIKGELARTINGQIKLFRSMTRRVSDESVSEIVHRLRANKDPEQLAKFDFRKTNANKTKLKRVKDSRQESYVRTLEEELDDAFGGQNIQPLIRLLNASHHIFKFYSDTTPVQIIKEFYDATKKFVRYLRSVNIKENMDEILQEIEHYNYFVNALDTEVDKWLNQINKEMVETNGMSFVYSSNLKTFVSDISSQLKTLQNTGITDISTPDWKMILQTMQDNNVSVYVLKQNNLWQDDFVLSSLDAQLVDNEVWTDLKKRDSLLRKNLRYIMVKLRSQRDVQTYIDTLKEVLSTLDSEQVRGKWLAQLDNTSQIKTFQDWIQGLFHNVLYAHRKEKIAFNGNIDKLVDKIMEDVDKQLNGFGIRNLLLKYYDSSFDDLLKKVYRDERYRISESKKIDIDIIKTRIDQLRKEGHWAIGDPIFEEFVRNPHGELNDTEVPYIKLTDAQKKELRQIAKQHYEARDEYYQQFIEEAHKGRKLSTVESINKSYKEEFLTWGSAHGGEISDQPFPHSFPKKYKLTRETLVPAIWKEKTTFPSKIPPKYYLEDVLDDVSEQIRACITGYLKDMQQVAAENNMKVISVYKSISANNIANRMEHLSSGYSEIMSTILNKKSLMKKELSINLIQDISKTISAMSTQNLDRTAVNKLLANKLNPKQLDKVINSLIYLKGSTIRAELRNALGNVGLVNKKLRGAIIDGKGSDLLATIIGPDGNEIRIENMLGIMYGDEINTVIQTTSDMLNMYDFSTATNLGFEKVLSKEAQDAFKIYVNNFVDTVDGVELVKAMKLAEQYIDYVPLLNKNSKQLERMRANLRQLTQELNKPGQTAVIFKDATYFDKASASELYFWDAFYSNKTTNEPIAKRYKAIKKEHGYHESYKKRRNYSAKADYHINPLSIVHEYEQTSGLITSPEDLVHIQQKTNYEYMPIHQKAIEKDFRRNVKDLDSLSRFKEELLNYIDRDVKALDEIRNFDTLRNDNRFVSELKLSKTDRRDLQRHGIIPEWTKVNDPIMDRYFKAKRQEWLVDNIARFTPQELRSFLDYENEGWFFISIPKGRDPRAFFNFTKQELKEAGVKINKVSEVQGDVFFVYRTDNIKRARCHNFTAYTFKKGSELQKLQDIYTNAFRNNYLYFHTDGMRIIPELMTGDLMSNEVSTYLRKSKALEKYFGDITIQKTYSDLDDLGNSNFYEKNIPRPDLAFIGELDCYNQVMDLAESTNTLAGISRPDLPRTMSMADSATSGTVVATKMANTEHKFAQLIANDDFDIGNEMFRPVFEKASNKEIKQFFGQGSFVPCVLREDPITKRPKIYRYSINNKRDVAMAIKDKVLLLPYEVYRSGVLVFNKHKVNNKLINFYTDVIVKTYKSIWLSTPGFIMRNFLDSAIYKNLSATDGMSGLLANFKYEYKAAKLLDWYDDVYKKIIAERVRFGGPAVPNALYIRKVLQTMSESDQQMFILMLAFERSGGAAGLTKTVEQAMINYNRAMNAGSVNAATDAISDLLYKASPMSLLNKANDRVERVSRLGLLLNLIDNGTPPSNAFRKVIDTHFDYELADAELGLLGDIFWFLTFPVKNSLYYLNEGLTKNPDMLKIQMDLMEISWNSDGMTWEDVKESKFLARNAASGNIRLSFNGKEIVVKTGSSVLDFFKILFDPVTAAKERLNPFLSVLLGQDQTSELNPLSSMGYRMDQILKGRSLIPSVYTTLYPRKNYPKRHYIERPPYVRGSSSSWNFKKPRKFYFKKPDNMKRMRYRFATHRYYFTKGKHLHRYTSAWSSVDPTWYSNNYRYRKLYNKYIKLPELVHYSDLR